MEPREYITVDRTHDFFNFFAPRSVPSAFFFVLRIVIHAASAINIEKVLLENDGFD
jgi:hypothetical protein